MATRSPDRANAAATAAPMPREAPVTNTARLTSGDDAARQRPERCALRVAERRQELIADLFLCTRGALERDAPLVGDVDHVPPPVGGIPPALDVAHLFEFVEQQHA